MNEKDGRVSAYCEQHGYAGIVIRRRANIAWIADGADVHCDTASTLGVATLLWSPQRKIVFTDNIESARLRAEEFGDEWEIEVSNWWEPAPPLPAGRYATDYPDDPLTDLRASLTAAEIERARSLGADAAAAMSGVMRALQPGMIEHEVAGRLAGALRRQGMFGHVILVAADERIGKYRHPIPTERRIERTVMAAICAQRRGLIVSITRLVHFGRALPDDLRCRHDAVCRVDCALHDATRPGARWCEVLAEGVRAYRDTGFADEWARHHQGGPMGYEPRDFKATPTETRCVALHQLVGWNPSITGTKSEDTILSTGEVLTAMADWPMNGRRPDILCAG
jgi:antitoxin VapB